MIQKNVLLVGPPRVGKTTVIQKILSLLKFKAGGFYTQAAEKLYHTNFRIVTVDGRNRSITDADLIRRLSVGVAFNHVALEEAGARAVQSALGKHPVVVVDQLGTWELGSRKFQDVVTQALDSQRCLLATATTSDHPFLAGVKLRRDVRIFTVSEVSRSTLPGAVARHVTTVIEAIAAELLISGRSASGS